MPELPEVETIRSQLSEYLPLKIDSVSTTPQLKQNILHTDLDLTGKTLVTIKRKGKMLDFIFDDGSHLLSHLGMTGTWLIGETIKATKHTHLTLKGPNYTLAYDDPRRFGHMYYYSAEEAALKLAELGLDLADPEFDIEYLTNAIKRYPERALKVTLLDQKLFAGSGNYIANEICARAGIRPTRKCKQIKKDEFPKILNAIKQVLEPALQSGGTTFQGGYRDSTGEYGQGVQHLVVFYQKTCQLCKKTPVKKIILAQRGTYYCPKCQK
ncbi:Fpg/Nei family DNA glycosylase [Peredibacter starrii]|uniref:DNA-formamidopyrimidine glycosylase family protein n=1 Tax=Peredibacter starrii TaxID=28202 RepID=A0AAX4HK17_9BACT|nr:DNA-formamidopyrimidine glycosylase family protein [Peredibacter starrii]WPU63584.1 DNA-formamidopyrimidine glycosylase family protein [Peredibacter starrii]